MKPLKNVVASVHQRLLNLARQSGRPFNELAQYYALERWLYRLAQSDYRNLFILKGALMLLVWKMPVTRPTRDIDLLGRVSNDLASVGEVIATICRVPTEDDGMFFDSKTVTTGRIEEDADYEGVRAAFRASLGKTLSQCRSTSGSATSSRRNLRLLFIRQFLDIPRQSTRTTAKL